MKTNSVTNGNTIVIDLTTDEEYEFKSRGEASKFTGIQRKHINDYIKRGLIYKKRYKFLNGENNQMESSSKDILIEVIDDTGVKLTHNPTGIVIINKDKDTHSKNIQEAINRLNAILRSYIKNPKDKLDRLINELLLARNIYNEDKLNVKLDGKANTINLMLDNGKLAYKIEI